MSLLNSFRQWLLLAFVVTVSCSSYGLLNAHEGAHSMEDTLIAEGIHYGPIPSPKEGEREEEEERG
jgi:hypothetical protein